MTESTGDDVVYLNDHGDVAVGASLTDYTAVTSFYTMPRTGASKAACLELAVNIDGRDYTLPVYLNRGALGGGTGNNENLPLDITANKVYKVDVSIERQSFTVAMEIRWCWTPSFWCMPAAKRSFRCSPRPIQFK